MNIAADIDIPQAAKYTSDFILFGAEYIYASLRRKDDFKWIAPRFQASVTFFLNRPQEQ